MEFMRDNPQITRDEVVARFYKQLHGTSEDSKRTRLRRYLKDLEKALD